MHSTELSVAQDAARAASEILLRYFRSGVTMRTKDVANLVSDADIEAEHAIVDIIHRTFPSHAVLAEEAHAGDASAEHLWIVDPLDGTCNFAHKVPQFAVSIAYYRAGKPECGVIVNPVRDEWYIATKGGGAFADGERAHVAEDASLDEALVAFGFYYDRGAMLQSTLDTLGDFKRRQIHGIRRFGAAALDLCMVGTGQVGIFFEYTLSPWDFAAGRLFVEEAGGCVTTTRGESLPIGKSGVLATNGRLHLQALEVLAAHHP